MTINDFYKAGNTIVTAAQLSAAGITFLSDAYFNSKGISTLDAVIKLKYGYATLISDTAADVQTVAVSVLLMEQEKYKRWLNTLKADYTLLKGYSESVTHNKTNTGTVNSQNSGAITRTDNTTETLSHGLTSTHNKNSYNSATLISDNSTVNSGSDTTTNTGTVTSADTTANVRTDNLTENITITKSGYKDSPTEIFEKELEFFKKSFFERLADDICNYITYFDFYFGA